MRAGAGLNAWFMNLSRFQFQRPSDFGRNHTVSKPIESRSVLQQTASALLLAFLGLIETILQTASQDSDVWFPKHSIVAADDIVALKWPAY